MEKLAESIYGRPIPGKDIKFPEEDFLDLKFEDSKIWTYRYPSQPAKAVGIVIHGLNSHAGVYACFAKTLSEASVETVGFDFLGHGKSEGQRGTIFCYRKFLALAETVIRTIASLYKNKPIFLIGGSMGGLISLISAINLSDHIRGMILFAPCVGTTYRPEGLLRVVANVLSTFVPGLPLSRGNVEMACKNKEISNILKADPLMYKGKVKVRTCANILKMINHFHKIKKNLSVPFICVQGMADPVVCPKAVTQWYEGASVTDKTLVVFPELKHSIYYEPEYEEMLDQVLHWLKTRSL